MLNYFFKKLLKRIGYTVSSVDLTMEGCLERCLKKYPDINSVIDVGAAVGGWSKMTLQYLPEAQYLLIEAQTTHKVHLERLKKRHSNVQFTLAAAGNRTGKIYFNISNLFGGVASEKPFDNNCIEAPVTTIDIEVQKNKLKPPFLIKLDTHGFEVPILEGATKTLKQAKLIIIEAYNYQIAKDSLRFYELCQYMSNIGFSPIELADCMLRPYDNSLWQMDIFFIPSNSEIFEYRAYE